MSAAFRAPLAALLLWFALAGQALAVLPDEMLSDPALEARAKALSAELRCMVCQNQSIDDSNADLAHDLRVLVRERIKAGDSDEEVIDYVVSRYGEFVLLEAALQSAQRVAVGGTGGAAPGRRRVHSARRPAPAGCDAGAVGRRKAGAGRDTAQRLSDSELPGARRVAPLNITKVSFAGNAIVMS